MVDEYLVGQYQLNQDEIFQIFQEANSFIGGRFGKIADEIINYKVSSIGSELFTKLRLKNGLALLSTTTTIVKTKNKSTEMTIWH